ncbi:hypothetical protein [Micromonospora chalcea]|uniref:hypothetical protein n=1 Tax=Micromonospora chalcea TaxID=1874 RepID=UPI0037B24552
MKAPVWSALAAWVALGISIANLWYSVIRLWWRERKATPSARLDLFDYHNKSGWHEEVRVVVTNHGPADMKKVEVQLFDGDGTSLEVREPSISVLWPKMPLGLLHPGDALYLTLNLSGATRDPKAALIRWEDGRRSQQSRWIWLSYHRVT